MIAKPGKFNWKKEEEKEVSHKYEALRIKELY